MNLYFLVFKYDGIDQFREYLTNNWFDDDCKFPIYLWNHYNNRGQRSNNHIEEYNLKMKNMLSSYPFIWKFISKIKKEVSIKKYNFKTIFQVRCNLKGF